VLASSRRGQKPHSGRATSTAALGACWEGRDRPDWRRLCRRTGTPRSTQPVPGTTTRHCLVPVLSRSARTSFPQVRTTSLRCVVLSRLGSRRLAGPVSAPPAPILRGAFGVSPGVLACATATAATLATRWSPAHGNRTEGRPPATPATGLRSASSKNKNTERVCGDPLPPLPPFVCWLPPGPGGARRCCHKLEAGRKPRKRPRVGRRPSRPRCPPPRRRLCPLVPERGDARQPAAFGTSSWSQKLLERSLCGDSPRRWKTRPGAECTGPHHRSDVQIVPKRERLIAATTLRLRAEPLMAATRCKHKRYTRESPIIALIGGTLEDSIPATRPAH
jgi:hypothetical protein